MAKTDISEPKDKNLLPISVRTTVHLNLQETKRTLTFGQQSHEAHKTVQNTFFLVSIVCFCFFVLWFIAKFRI